MAQRKPWDEYVGDDYYGSDEGGVTTLPDEEQFANGNQQLASRGSRLAAHFVDGLATLGVMLPGIVCLVGASTFAENQRRMGRGDNPALVLGALAVMIVPALILAIYQIVQLSKYGQTIGKRAMKVKIVKVNDDSAPGFVHAWLLRSLVTGIIGNLPFGIGVIFSLINILCIFGEDRRCIHDMIAGTKVVKA